MIKWPEPVAWLCNWDGHFAAMTNKPEPVNAYKSVEPLVKEAQLKQAVRDAYEDAAQACSAEAEGRGDEDAFVAKLCAFAIRALIEEIV